MATLTTRRGYYILSWSENGKRRRQSLGLVSAIPKRDAEACLRVKQYELSTGAKLLNASRRPAPRFEDFVKQDYLLWHRMEYPDSHYRVAQIAHDHLIPKFGITPINLIAVHEAEQFKTERKAVARASTVTKEIRTLQAILNRAVDLKIIQENPIAIVQPPRTLDSKPHHWYVAPELQRLYAASAYGATWKLLANTGLRRTEGLLLRWDWITDKTIRILSTEEERTKSGEWREIPRSEGATAALAELERSGPYVLPRMEKASLSRACARDIRRAGLEGSLHTLRHTYVCHLLLKGVPIRTVQLYAGHAHISTTERYAYQVLRNDPRAAVRMAI